MASLHHYIIASLHHDIMASWHHGIDDIMALKYCQVLNSSSPSETRAKCLLIHTVPVNSWSLSIYSFLGLKEKMFRHLHLFEVFLTKKFSTSEVFIMNLVGMSWVETNIHEKLRIIDIIVKYPFTWCVDSIKSCVFWPQRRFWTVVKSQWSCKNIFAIMIKGCF